ncbi:MAG: SixA phosphatase family protein [Saccharofermentanales bacterium]|jgi:phosphohistidine phosphatase|nr:phosphohistidine phosphatase SixA [Clostridiaceae bacterium]
MKKLYLLRHAKSGWDNSVLRDYDRPLDVLGRSQAKAMGRFFQENAFKIDGMLCSGALRARQTLELLLALYAYLGKIEYRDEIYASSTSILKNLILEAELDHLLLVGHNPEISMLAGDLTGQALVMSTCQLAVIDMEKGRLEIFTRPEIC